MIRELAAALAVGVVALCLAAALGWLAGSYGPTPDAIRWHRAGWWR